MENILKEIMAMKIGETNTFKITDNRFLFVDNWSFDDDDFTSLELNSGEEIEDEYVLDDVLDCVTCDFGNERDIARGIDYMIACCK